jgi:hypothetical protein
MKKVFQTIVDKDHGNCMQAAVASLLDMELDEVPNFIELGHGWFLTMRHFFEDHGGYDICTINKSRRQGEDTEYLRRIAKFDGGVNGYLYASVPSQTFENIGHAVIVDLDLNIVHDPNPNQLALKLTPDDVRDIMVVHDMIIGKTGKLFKKADWDAATEEERDANTWRVKYDENKNIIGSE